MKPTDFLTKYAIQSFFHFTERSNLPSIRQHGLLSLREITRLGIQNIQYASSSQSRVVDMRQGYDEYVRVAFVNQHPMEYIARKEGRIKDTVFLSIKTTILTHSGVCVASGVAYKHDVQIYGLIEACDKLDFDILYFRSDWKDPVIKKRLLAARKYELLIPNRIAPELIGGLPNG